MGTWFLTQGTIPAGVRVYKLGSDETWAEDFSLLLTSTAYKRLVKLHVPLIVGCYHFPIGSFAYWQSVAAFLNQIYVCRRE